ncbi:siderophore-interacting protein [Paenarthrobacter sp. NPDC090522]|uniref:siderophore-interacting protein n=1 Tax=Paenarthrobacter sp. NPDC090522 TaxID=3364383 RepID=UPI00382E4CBC
MQHKNTAPTNAGAPVGGLPQAYLRGFPIRIREVLVLRRVQLTPRMIRLTLGGQNMVRFESHIADEHVKLIFPDPDTGELRVPEQDDDHLHWPKPMPVTRDYTVRRYDAAAGEFDLDFVVHDHGTASDWARTTPLGAPIWVAGPPRGVVIPDEFRWQAYFGDETALPAIARRLEELPSAIIGYAVIEVGSADDELPLVAPPGMEIRWLHRNGAEPGTTRLLAEAAETIEIPQDGHSYVWAAGEAGSLKPLRKWIKAAGLGKHSSDVDGYWKRGEKSNQEPGVVGTIINRLAHGH